MSYVTKYTVPFKSLRNTEYTIEIQEEGFTGTATELTGAPSPFVINIDDEDFLYTPTRFSTAKLSLVGSDYLQELYSTQYQQFRVLLKKGGIVVWRGFIKPEIYTQDYTDVDFELQVECISAMSALEYIDYAKAGEGYAFISLWDLVKKCVTASKSDYTSILIPHVYAKNETDYNSYANVLASMTVSEQNFFDEDDKAMKLKEVLEEICKLMNWTCVDWSGSLYFVDIDHVGEYYQYNTDLTTYNIVEFEDVNIQQIGFAGSNNTLDVLGGYNKASVKTSNYNVGEIFPDEDFDALQLFATPDDVVVDNKVAVKKIYTPSVYKLYHYNNDYSVVSSVIPSQANDLLGAFPVKVDSYNKVNNGSGEYTPDITDYSYEECIQARVKTASGTKVDVWHQKKMLEFARQLPVSTYSNGAIAISCSMRMLGRSDLAFFEETLETSDIHTSIKCSLSIGTHYWSGTDEAWTTDSAKNFFYIYFDRTEIAKGGFVNNQNKKKLNMPYEGLSGYIIPLPPAPYAGEIKFSMDLPMAPDDLIHNINAYGFLIKDLKLTFKKTNYLEDVTSKNNDRIYTNVVNAYFINELDEIEFKISSWNNDDLCFAKVMLGSDYLTDNLYCSITGSNIRPEEQLIRRIVSQYDSTKIKLSQVLMNSSYFNPVSRLSDNYMTNKKFLLAGGEIDFEGDSFSAKMIEI